MQGSQDNSSKNALKSIGIIGSSQAITIVIGVVKMKIVALLLGPIGIGIMGLYQSINDMIKQIASLGLNFSAVRDVAIAKNSNDSIKISFIFKIVTRWIVFTSILGLLFTIIFSKKISILTFNNENQTQNIQVLSIAIFFSILAAGQIAILQGLGQIKNMAKATVFGSFLGFLITVPIYFFLGIKGIAISLAISAVISFLLTWWYIKKIALEDVKIDLNTTLKEGTGMVKLGFYTVLSGFLVTGAMYLIRLLIIKKINIEAVGQFQAAWTISFVYISLVLNAMAADYYPKLSAVNDNNRKLRRMINEQVELTQIIIIPIITLMLSFLNLIVGILYSSKFDNAAEVLKWQILGTYFMVVSYPIGYVLMAKNRGILYFFCNISFYIIFVILIFFGLDYFGIQIIGFAFLVSYLFFFIILLFIMKIIINYRMNRHLIKLIFFNCLIIALAFFNSMYLSEPYKLVIGLFLTLFAFLYSYEKIKKFGDIGSFFKTFLKKN